MGKCGRTANDAIESLLDKFERLIDSQAEKMTDDEFQQAKDRFDKAFEAYRRRRQPPRNPAEC